jgi:phosphoglycolate phosphatase
MIGDRGDDMTGAHANGIHAIAVTWGYAADGELAAARPHAIVQSPSQLLEYVEGAD